MCRFSSKVDVNIQKATPRFLFGPKSFDCGGNQDGSCLVGINAPPLSSTFTFIGMGVVFLFMVEHILRAVFAQFQHVHPVLLPELNRNILARHIGVDTLACSLVGYFGLRHGGDVCRDLWDNLPFFSPTKQRNKNHNSLPDAAYDQRLFGYRPVGQMIGTMFVSYQVKNLYDTFVWHDGWLFVFHHVLAGSTAWGAMYPGCGHTYMVFFMGMSEVSTAILCLLANFDDDHGVVGLGDAFPITKLVVAVLFVVLFVAFRTILWPYFGYHFARDVMLALQQNNHLLLTEQHNGHQRRRWLIYFVCTLTGLTVLQIIWLGQIFITLQKEIANFL